MTLSRDRLRARPCGRASCSQVKKTPQDVWTEVVAGAAEDTASVDPAIRKYLPRLAELNNTPRKEAKFRNFIKNSLKLWDEAVITKLWKFLDGRWVEATGRSREAEQPPKSKSAEPDSDSDDAIPTKSAKSARDAEARPSKKRPAEKEEENDTDDAVAPAKTAKKAKVTSLDASEATVEAEADAEAITPELPKWKKTIRRALKTVEENATLADLRSAYIGICTEKLGAACEKVATDNFNQRLLEATATVSESTITLNLF